MKTQNLSEWETGAFKPVHILMLRGRHYWLCIFINHAIPDIQRKLQELKARPQTPLSTLVEGAFKVYNSQDLTEEANKDKRLIKNKKQILTALIHAPPRGDPAGPRWPEAS